jgi:selenocysteine lyase/cysteine desulfurase
MKFIHHCQGALAAGGQEGERHSSLQGPWGLRENFMAAVRLRSTGVMVSARGAAGVWGIRASVHFPNREEDVEALGEALRELRT